MKNFSNEYNNNNNPESVLENETHKFFLDFEIQTEYLISVRRPDLMIFNSKKKRTCRIVGFAVPADNRVKVKESEKSDKYLDFARELEKKQTNCGT